MISPELYNQAFIEGRPAKQIRKEINLLKDRIRSLITLAEDPYTEDVSFSDKKETVIHNNIECLKSAIKSFVKAGGTYIPSKEVKAVIDFDESLNELSELAYKSFGYPGWENVTCTFSEKEVSIAREGLLMGPEEKTFTVSKDEFISALKDLHLGMWKRCYEREFVFDGEEWKLKLTFSNGKTKKYSGYNHYPWNFEELRALLGIGEEEEYDESDQN